jgi:hypothetical protein
MGHKVQIWITLKGVHGEFLEVADQITVVQGEVVGNDKKNAYCTDQRFCVALVSDEGYKIQAAVKNNYISLVTIIEVDYGNLSIKCRFCQAIDHLI